MSNSIYSCNRLLQLYGFDTEKKFIEGFNKTMRGGTVLFAPPNTQSPNGTSMGVYVPARKRTGNRAGGAFGRPPNCLGYPVIVYGSLINGIGITGAVLSTTGTTRNGTGTTRNGTGTTRNVDTLGENLILDPFFAKVVPFSNSFYIDFKN